MSEAQNPLGHIAQIELAELTHAAAGIAGFKMTEWEYGGARNITGIRTGTLTFSRRLDSRTFFAADSRYGHLGKAGAWTGADKTALSRCRKLMHAAGLPAAEIVSAAVVSEFGAVAQRVSNREFKHGDPHLLRKIVQVKRVMDGIPVWSSYVRLGLTDVGEVGVLELHWPALNPVVIKEARVLKAMVESGFEPPRLAGARLESLAAGIIHSPAIGFFMDTVATIRAIYAGDDPSIGRKPTLYLDRHGEPVAMPRDIALPNPEPRNPRPTPKARARTTDKR